MILVGNQRGGARDLALHLMKDENDHVHVHEMRGFVSETLEGAFTEAYAMSKATRCRQFLFSLSLNPPKTETVETAAFEDAIERAEKRLGLTGQPRAVVFHEKEGRRHAHAVWSRIKADEMKAVQLSHSKNKLMEVSRDLYREHGWRMPEGMTDRSKRDPRNFTLEEWQQAKRKGKDPRAIKAAIQDAWAISDSKAALVHALEERGFKLARGDRRGYVALDHTGEPYALARYAGVKTKEVRQRLGEPESLPSIEDARRDFARDMLPAFDRMQAELAEQEKRKRQEAERRRAELVQRQRTLREKQAAMMQARQAGEARRRQERFRRGAAGVWDRLTGDHKRIQQENERDAWQAHRRDQAFKDQLIFRHLEDRRRLDQDEARLQSQEAEKRIELEADRRLYEDMGAQDREARKAEFMRHRQQQAQAPTQTRNRDGPDLSR